MSDDESITAPEAAILESLADTSLESLKRQRAVLRGKITRWGKWIANTPNIPRTTLELRHRALISTESEFEVIQAHIERILDDEVENEEQRSRFEDQFFTVATLFEDLLNKGTICIPTETPQIVSQPSSDNGLSERVNGLTVGPSSVTSHPSVRATTSPELKLPPIQLPSFSGVPEEFQAFKELFTAIVNDSHHLSDVTRFYYLKSSLKGSAATVLQSIPVIGNNYNMAWQLLSQRYEQRGTSVDRLNQELLNLPTVQTENAQQLRRLLDNALRIIRSLKSMGAIDNTRDTIFSSIIASKMDNETRKHFRLSLPSANHIPTFDELFAFVDKRVQAMESIVPNKRESNHRHIVSHQAITDRRQPKKDNRSHNATTECLLCGSTTHRIPRCKEFTRLTLNERSKLVRQRGLCFNCLSPQHLASDCNSKFSCQKCGKKHHTVLHFSGNTNMEATPSTSAVTLFNTHIQDKTVLLSTAMVFILDINRSPVPARCLLDSGSQSNFMTQNFAHRLQLPLMNSFQRIVGIGQTKGQASKRVFATLRSRYSRFKQNMEFVVLSTITQSLPSIQIDISRWDMPHNIELADETFNIPSTVDVLLGANMFFKILYRNKFAATRDRPALIQTTLGWIVGGDIPNSKDRINTPTLTHLSLSEQVEKFWSVEECAPASQLTEEERLCENHFESTHYRDTNGRYVVSLPFRQSPLTLGNSRSQARRRWMSVEARLSRNKSLAESYHEFMKSYISLGHMVQVGEENIVPESSGSYHLPHHPVFKSESTSTKVRVVFDGSARTSNGLSLNDVLMVGPTVQEELFKILLRFRKHRYVFSGDIEKMYRQILINEKDANCQLILWRAKPSEPLIVYQLKTVTYGTSSAPYLATKCLSQLAKDEARSYPDAAAAIKDFYVDDLLSGSDDLTHALSIQRQMINMLNAAGFPIKKWAANNDKLLREIPPEDRELLGSLNLMSGEAVRTLGLIWLPRQDVFVYNANKIVNTPATTKRQVLSQLASLYDPPGLLSPIICTAKLFMKTLWERNLPWDDTIPVDLAHQWQSFNTSLSHLSEIRIPRHAGSNQFPKERQLHGFADASEQAYGCAIYLRTIDTNNTISTHLLCAKSRIAPKKHLTLPRLELSAAVLLTRLMQTVVSALQVQHLPTYCWTDSRIVLSWLNAAPTTWKTFVANRVSEIQEYKTKWLHIRTCQNPADIVSRGCTVTQLKDSSLWWNGPKLLMDSTQPWREMSIPVSQDPVPETRTKKVIAATSNIATMEILTRYSTLFLAVNVTAWCLRFKHNAKHPSDKQKGPLSLQEIEKARICLLRLTQAEGFSREINAIYQKGHVPKNCRMAPLQPFLDDQGILCVGGRLSNTNLKYFQKHPALLPPDHTFTKLVIEQEHIRSLHGGPQLVLSVIRQRYWIINGRNVIRKVLHKCTRCFRVAPRNMHPIMGQLPTSRTEPSRAFYHTGVDFAGPFLLRPPTRSNVKLKYYVAVFVCMATRAVHFELVGSLSTESFLATLKRFTARRGLCATLSCDNATNFVGARNELKEIYKFLKENGDAISHSLAQSNIQWKFIPPLSPHFGGLWEAAVKSMKSHLKRVAGLALLTYEEFTTFLYTVEACLNSRPLVQLTPDPTDYEALTPGHFLTGAPLLAVPEINLAKENITRLNRWNLIQSMTQQFWRRWSKEYVSLLQPLSKWTDPAKPITAGQLVLIKEPTLPPLQWRLGRITQTYPGLDDVTRVVDVNTRSGVVTRNTHMIYPLPID